MGSLQARLLAAVGLLAIAAVVAVALAARHGARLELLSFADLERKDARGDVVRVLEELAGAHPAGFSALELEAASGRLPADTAALLVDDQGELVAAVGERLRVFGGVRTERRGDSLVVTAGPGAGGEALELHLQGGSVPVRLAGGAPGTLVPLVLPSERQREHAAAAFGALDRRLLAITAAAAAAALLLTWALARGILKPIRQLQQAAHDLERGQLDRRVQAAGPDELADLGRAFNAMAAELERQRRLRKDLVSDVAHELRTPLTSMLCRLEAGADGLDRDPAATLAGFRGDVVHLTGLVGDLQELALAEAGQLRLDRVPSSLAAAVAAAVRTAGLEADRRVRSEVDGDTAVHADPLRLRQILVNLLSNAARHTPAEGTIRISAEIVPGEVRVEVADSGCGLGAEQLARVFERFYRTDPARQRETGGSGLGLAIVKTLVEAQGGRVWARGAPQQGAVFGFALPSAAATRR